MWSWLTFWLFLHILAAIVAFGPTFAFGLIGAQVGKEPIHAAFGVHIMDLIERRMTIPFALSLPVSGTGLIGARGSLAIGVASHRDRGVSVRHHLRDRRAGEVLRNVGGDPAVDAAGTSPRRSLGAASGGGSATKKLQIGGGILTVAVLVILLLMIWRPGAAFS
jgi:hypothetical protein